MYFEFNSIRLIGGRKVIGHSHRVVEQEVVAETDLQRFVVLHSLTKANQADVPVLERGVAGPVHHEQIGLGRMPQVTV